MRLSSIEASNIIFDAGYSSSFQVTILFIDQNHIQHQRIFRVSVFGEKPTQMEIYSIGNFNCERHLIFRTSSDSLNSIE